MRGRGKGIVQTLHDSKKAVAATQQSAALLPNIFTTWNELCKISFMQAYTPLYTPNKFDALSELWERQFIMSKALLGKHTSGLPLSLVRIYWE